jgi:SAM-dependent methyltransferase
MPDQFPAGGSTPPTVTLDQGGADPGDPASGLLEVTRNEGWQRAAHDLLRTRDPQAYRMAVDEYRSNWRLLLPVSSRSRVLELNCGHGAASLVLAEVGATTTAVDAGWERAAFAALRGHQQGVGNLRLLQALPTGPLPFRDRSFDVVAYTGSLTTGTAADLLSEAHRVLVGGGCVYVATRNRHGIPVSPFGRDGRASSVRGGQPGSDRLAVGPGLTPARLRELLRQSGFSDVRMYAALPSHELSFFFVPIENPRVFAYYVRRLTEVYEFGADLRRHGLGVVYSIGSYAARIALRVGLAPLLRQLVPSIAAVARR